MTKIWGTPTWNLLHCIPEKVDDIYYNKNKDMVIAIVEMILIGLPCPDCSEHSLKVFYKYKKHIHSKETLKKCYKKR